MEEIWKDVFGYEGSYKISNFGNVKSLERLVKNQYSFRLVKERILKQQILRDGYLYVMLSSVGTKTRIKSRAVHQLLAIAFMNHKRCKFEIVVDHIDNNKLNNNLDNLQLISNRENSTKDVRNKYGYLGVSKTKGRYKATIRINGVSTYLGTFATAELANERYKEVRAKIEFDNLHK